MSPLRGSILTLNSFAVSNDFLAESHQGLFDKGNQDVPTEANVRSQDIPAWASISLS